MDRSLWLSLLAVGLVIALLFTGRMALDARETVTAAGLITEIEGLEGAPASADLAERTTEAAGCLYGFRPRVHSCWYVWAAPTRADYLMVVAERAYSDSEGSTIGWATGSLPFWLLAAFAAWKAIRMPRPTRPSAMAPTVEPTRPAGRLMP